MTKKELIDIVAEEANITKKDAKVAIDALLGAVEASLAKGEDGTLYAIDNGSNYSGHLDGISLKVSQSLTVTKSDGERKKETTTIKLNLKHAEIVLSAEAVEMNAEGEELARHKLTGQEEIWVSPETEWLLIEETLNDFSIRRSTVNGPLNQETFFIYTPELPGVCIRETYTIRTSGVLSDETQPG